MSYKTLIALFLNESGENCDDLLPLDSGFLLDEGRYGFPCVAAARYHGAAMNAVKACKFGGRRYVCKFMADEMARRLEPPECDIITFVPLHKNRERARGFNQSALVAGRLGRIWKKPVVCLIRRHTDTLQQSRLSYGDRQKNVAGAFESAKNAPDISGKTILIIDDVVTTGATMRECIKILEQMGGRPIGAAFANGGDIMGIKEVREYLAGFGMEDRIMEFPVSSATVELAAEALGTMPGRIAKTISFRAGDGALLIVAAGDVKIDNKKYKAQFSARPKMLSHDEASEITGFEVGGVCPFAKKEGVAVYIDESLRRFDTVYPACGSSNSAIELTPDELFRISGADGWSDVCVPYAPAL